MKNILVIGSTGQIGSELTMELRKRYGGYGYGKKSGYYGNGEAVDGE